MNKRAPAAKRTAHRTRKRPTPPAAPATPSGAASPVAKAPIIACFGEILWDCLPRGIFLGGAPLNVAYHLSRLGLAPLLVSAVGRDFLGDEALRRLAGWGLDTSRVARVRPATGTVRATLDADGVARYVFDPAPAWDHLPAPPAPSARRAAPAAVVFGTLALREPANRRGLKTLLDAWPDALRVVDLNLRPPFARAAAISWALKRAHLLKLNDEELATLTRPRRVPATPGGLAAAARHLARLHGIARICVTAGPRGAGLLWDGAWHWADARPVEVRDTVGAGDAFLAALLAALLARNEPPELALSAACRLGEYVATQDGATPAYRVDARGRPQLVR